MDAVSFTNRPFCITNQRPNPHIFLMIVSFNESKVDTLQQSGEGTKDYVFPLFSLIDCILAKVRKERCCTLAITPAWQKQAWYTTQLRISAQNPILTLQTKRLLTNSQGKIHFLVQKCQLSGLTISGNPSL